MIIRNAKEATIQVVGLMAGRNYDQLDGFIHSSDLAAIADFDASPLLAMAIENRDIVSTRILAHSGRVNFSFKTQMGYDLEQEAAFTQDQAIIDLVRSGRAKTCDEWHDVAHWGRALGASARSRLQRLRHA